MNDSISTESTWVACLTPPGSAAIATLAVRGPRAWRAICEIFKPSSKRRELPAEPQAGQSWFGRMGEISGTGLADDVVLLVKQGLPRPSVEIHCHGGREVVRYLQEVLALRQVQSCTWQELERNTSSDPLQLVALTALVEARTTRTAAILLDQYHGAFSRVILDIQGCFARNEFLKAWEKLNQLVQWSPVGRHLTNPWRVVIAGPPNAGKSSLVNALAGYQRCIVSSTPGTTRDVVTTLIAVDGWPVEIADTAGVRESEGLVERMGIERAQHAIDAADLTLWLLDRSVAPIWPSFSTSRIRFIETKIDLPRSAMFEVPAETLAVSAKTGAGLEELCQALADWLVPSPPPAGSAVPFTRHLCDRVDFAQRLYLSGQEAEAAAMLQTMMSE